VCSRASTISWLTWSAGVSKHQWNGRLAALRSRVEQGVVDGHGAEHAWRPAPANSCTRRAPRRDDGDASVLRVEPALELALRSVEDAACPGSMNGHRLTSAKVTRGDPARGFMILLWESGVCHRLTWQSTHFNARSWDRSRYCARRRIVKRSPGRWRCGEQFSASNSIAVSPLCNAPFRSANPTCSDNCDDLPSVTATGRRPAEPGDASPVRH
jgi:hypothetical protein